MKRQYFGAIGLILGALLSGCANQPANQQAPEADSTVAPLTAEERAEIRTLLANYPQHNDAINAWQARRGDVERLLALEDEFKILISQLNALAVSAEPATTTNANSNEQVTPVPAPTTASKAEPQAAKKMAPVSESVRVEKTDAQQTEAIAGQYGVQLAAMTEKQSLVALWRSLNSQAPTVFSAQTPRYQKLTVNGNDIFRLKTGLFGNRTGADEMCRRVRALQRVCIVTQYDGSEQALTW
ncbi:SPOR domain-containing protein [Alteromonas gilva]|uniref:SPOR domain-containing protein n=1 Tax=Alteromonas gilva TaxID=2987522 RepID=A0ABT5KYB5_9ALTE|nr:SPOR domain-containing protein [Alteromonas gilva]MDC8829765.1 SPOR domain-containing protein [Alteromonas gilva]